MCFFNNKMERFKLVMKKKVMNTYMPLSHRFIVINPVREHQRQVKIIL